MRCFWGYNLLWQLLAIALSAILVTSGFDWAYFVFFRHTIVYTLLFPAVVIGALTPIIAPFVLYGIGQRRKDARITSIGLAFGQAALIGWAISSLYKAFSGRVPPELPGVPPTEEISRFFDFGFLRQGIFWGWPSSHTTVAFAMAFALIALYPKSKRLKYWALLYALYIGLGVSTSIHWFSDVVAGTIFGSVIGAVVGQSYRNRAPHNLANLL